MPATFDPTFAQLLGFESETRLFELRIEDIGAPLAVEGFVMREELSTLFEMDLMLLSPSAHIELSDLLHRQISLLTRLADGTHIARSGYITAAAYLDFDGALSRYRLRVSPWLWYSTLASHNRVFQDKFLLDIIDAVFAEYAPRMAWRATADVSSFLEGVPARSYCVQYNESDYDFIARLLAESGLGFYFEEKDVTTPGTLPGETPQQQLVIFASSSEFPEDYSSVHDNGGRGIRFHGARSQEDQDAIQVFNTQQMFQPAITTLASYDYKSKRILTSSLPSQHIGGSHAPQLEAYDYTGAYTFANLDQPHVPHAYYAKRQKRASPAIAASPACAPSAPAMHLISRKARWMHRVRPPLSIALPSPASPMPVLTT